MEQDHPQRRYFALKPVPVPGPVPAPLAPVIDRPGAMDYAFANPATTPTALTASAPLPPGQLDIPRHLAALPLFQEMGAAELQRLAAGCRLRQLARGQEVFRVGTPCEEFHVALTGQVKLFAISPGGQEKVIEIVSAGHSFAEALMFADQPYIINAQALSDVLLLTVAKATVLAEVERDPRFALRMLAGMSRRLHGLVHDVQAYALKSGVERVAGYLLQLQQDGPATVPGALVPAPAGVAPSVLLPVSKATLASRLSLTPEYFSRVLHELEAKGLITVDRREIHIHDPAALAREIGR